MGGGVGGGGGIQRGRVSSDMMTLGTVKKGTSVELNPILSHTLTHRLLASFWLGGVYKRPSQALEHSEAITLC